MNIAPLPATLNFDTTASIIDSNQQKFLVCCFFTPSYQEHAQKLKQSLEQLGIDYNLQPVPEQGHWEANTRVKPYFLSHCLQIFPDRDILYLDADAVVKHPLNHFNKVIADVAVYNTKRAEGMSHDYLTGTIFLKNTKATKDFVAEWCAVQSNCHPTMVDQDSFDIAMKKHRPYIQVEDLELGYVKIFDKDFDGKIYIEQYQASREQTKLKRKRIRWRNRALIIAVVAIFFATIGTFIE